MAAILNFMGPSREPGASWRGKKSPLCKIGANLGADPLKMPTRMKFSDFSIENLKNSNYGCAKNDFLKIYFYKNIFLRCFFIHPPVRSAVELQFSLKF